MDNQTYQLELKQIVEFPRCRIYRDFIRSLVTNKSIRTNGGSFLFYYIVQGIVFCYTNTQTLIWISRFRNNTKKIIKN